MELSDISIKHLLKIVSVLTTPLEAMSAVEQNFLTSDAQPAAAPVVLTQVEKDQRLDRQQVVAQLSLPHVKLLVTRERDGEIAPLLALKLSSASRERS